MSVFSDYARYYDLIYRDKDYAGEAAYVHELIQRHCPGAGTTLNLGCGSGRHDREMAKLGYQVTGIDISEEMLAEARAGSKNDQALAYHQGDVRRVRLNETYDAVVSLFHVMSYQINDQDLLAALETARSHLKPGGVFIFDCWYGPGVLTDRPTVRILELEDDAIKVTRVARPVMHPNDNVVDVNYEIYIKDKATEEVREIRETHRMRYLFSTEISSALARTGFKERSFTTWMTAAEPDFSTWNACITSVAI